MFEQYPRPRGQASRRATAVTLIVVLSLGVLAAWFLTDDAASQADGPTSDRPFPRETGVGACLRFADRTVDPDPIVDALAAVASENDHFFPTLGITPIEAGPDGGLIVALWPMGAPSQGATGVAQAATPCQRPGAALASDGSDGWSFAMTHDLLSDAADRLLEQADFGSDWTARLEVTLHPQQRRVRTKLLFSGPLGISGSCSIDETLVIDIQTGRPDVIRESHNDAGLAGLVACRRFEAELAAGGAAAQALALLPSGLIDDGARAMLAVTDVDVIDGTIRASGHMR